MKNLIEKVLAILGILLVIVPVVLRFLGIARLDLIVFEVKLPTAILVGVACMIIALTFKQIFEE